MGNIKGVNSEKMSSPIGNTTCRQAEFDTAVSAKRQKKATPSRSLRQMHCRMELAIRSSFFAAFRGMLAHSFENIPANWNAINAFISANSGRARVMLAKHMVASGAGVAEATRYPAAASAP